MEEIWRTIRLIVDLALGSLADVTQLITRVRGRGQTEIQVYLRGLRKLGLGVLFLPIPILIIGVIGNLGWLVAIVGIFWAICTVILMALSTPLGLIVESLAGGIKGSGERYIKLMSTVLVTELFMALFVSVVPIRNNLAALPVIIVASLILSLLGKPKTGFMTGAAGILLVLFTLSFFFPNSFKVIRRIPVKVDKVAAAGMESIIGDNASKATSHDQKKPPAQTAVITVSAGQVVRTDLYAEKNQRVQFTQPSPAQQYYLVGCQYNVLVNPNSPTDTIYIDRWVLPGEIQLMGGVRELPRITIQLLPN